MKKKELIKWLSNLDDETEIFIGDFDEYGDRISERADDIKNMNVDSDTNYVVIG